MANKDVIYEYRSWEDYINRYAEFPKIIRDISKFKSYLKDEIWDRLRRHNQVLYLFNLDEKINPNVDTQVDFFENMQYLGTCITPRGISNWILQDDRRPFERRIILLDGRELEIKDDFSSNMKRGSSEDNCFTTKLIFWKRKPLCIDGPIYIDDGKELAGTTFYSRKNNESEYEKELLLSYVVDACDNPVSLTIDCNGVYLSLSNGGATFRYSEGCRKRELSFFTSKELNDDYIVANYEEEFGLFDRQCGSVFVQETFNEASFKISYMLGGGFGKNPSNEIEVSIPYASFYSRAIVSHERSQELMRFVLKKLFSIVPGFEEFIFNRFPVINRYIGIEKVNVPEIDKVFNMISQPLLAFGKNGFVFDGEYFDELEEIDPNPEPVLKNKKVSKKDAEKKRRKEIKNAYKKSQENNSGE